MCTKQLALYWRQDSTTEATRGSVNKRVDTFIKEEPEHATEIVLALLEVVDEDNRIRSRAVTKSSVVSSTGFAFPSA